jgi:hypothetical protein
MSEGFEKLKNIGAQKIHEKTHIAKHHVQALLHESFDEMTKVQFIGFISILEREYSIQLEDLKESGIHYFQTLNAIHEEENQVFVAPKKKKSNTALYILLSFLLFAAAIFYSNSNNSESLEEQNATFQELEDSKKVENKALVQEDENSSDTLLIEDANISKEPVVIQEEVLAVEKSLKIIPNAKLWLGYINPKTHQKYQKLFSDSFELDAQKDWLLHLGHGDVTIVIHGEEKVYKNPDNMRFLYKDGEFKEITLSEFKSLNRGDRW